MKKSLIYLSLIIGITALSSYRAMEKPAPATPYFTITQADGTDMTKSLAEMKCADWSMPIVNAEFRYSGSTVAVTGLLVYSPKEGDAALLNIGGEESLIGAVRTIIRTAGSIRPGDRLIFDNWKIVGNDRNLMPIVYTATQ